MDFVGESLESRAVQAVDTGRDVSIVEYDLCIRAFFDDFGHADTGKVAAFFPGQEKSAVGASDHDVRFQLSSGDGISNALIPRQVPGHLVIHVVTVHLRASGAGQGERKEHLGILDAFRNL